MDPKIYLSRLRITELEAENKKLKQLANSKIHPPIQGETSIEEYHRSFILYITDCTFAREQFINGLSAKNKAKIPVTSEAESIEFVTGCLIRCSSR